MIILGSFLEAYYYVYRFINDGTNLIIAILISITLVVMLTLISSHYKKKYSWLMIIPLALYSIICTSAGQTFDLGKNKEYMNVEYVQQINKQDEINEIIADINRINIELNKVSNQNTVTNTYNVNKYQEALTDIQDRYDFLNEQKKQLQLQLSDLRKQQTIRTDIQQESQTDIYQFYNELAGLNIKWSQYILQTILSIFIALSAPLGLIILNNRKSKKHEISEISMSKDKIKRFVHLCWSWYRHDEKNPIVPFDRLQKYLDERQYSGTEITYQEYLFLFNKLLLNNFVDNKGNILYNDEESIIHTLQNIRR